MRGGLTEKTGTVGDLGFCGNYWRRPSGSGLTLVVGNSGGVAGGNGVFYFVLFGSSERGGMEKTVRIRSPLTKRLAKK